MIQSMTAFARREQTLDASHIGASHIACEIRGVNHRYLEAALRLPDPLRDIEHTLRERLRRRIRRGKIDVALRLTATTTAIDLQQIDTGLVERLAQAHKKIAALIGDPQPLSALEILRWDGVLARPEPAADQLHGAALDLFDGTLDDFIEQRAREGTALAGLITERLDTMSEIIDTVRTEMPALLAHQRRRILDKLAALDLRLDAERLEQELVLLAQRADVEEELDRLTTHVAEIRRVLADGGSVGRRLDFLMQELNRESNTLSSKALAATTAHNAVELKVLIEQMREQIQNID